MRTVLALAVAVTAPAFARTIHHNARSGLRAYDYTTQTPQNPAAMKWKADKAGGGSLGYNTHNEVSN